MGLARFDTEQIPSLLTICKVQAYIMYLISTVVGFCIRDSAIYRHYIAHAYRGGRFYDQAEYYLIFMQGSCLLQCSSLWLTTPSSMRFKPKLSAVTSSAPDSTLSTRTEFLSKFQVN